MAEGHLFRPPTIAGNEGAHQTNGRQNPFEILDLEPCRRRPKILLICDNMLKKRREQTILRIFARLQPIAILAACPCDRRIGRARGRSASLARVYTRWFLGRCCQRTKKEKKRYI